jgi:hypothetical protein
MIAHEEKVTCEPSLPIFTISVVTITKRITATLRAAPIPYSISILYCKLKKIL